MERIRRRSLAPPILRLLAAVLALGLVGGCSDDDGDTGAVEPDPPPSAVTVQAVTGADSVLVSWSAAQGAESYRTELSGPSTLSRTTTSSREVVFTAEADDLADGAEYTVTVYAVNAQGETPSANTPSVTTDFFPWDEYAATSLHVTGMGKQTFYGAVPNGGFEHYSGVPYQDLSCRTCHEPASTGGCQACHEEADPQLGATVDATLEGVCGKCHSRQKAEALVHGFTDVHRELGMGCMDCHSLEDVHGDGTEYASMLEPGAIDASCLDCHGTMRANEAHTTHLSTVACAACHTRSVVTCYNCHFETQVQVDQKKAYGQFTDWLFLVNRNGKVDVANLQSLTHGGNSMVSFAPFYAHTITRNAWGGCVGCHGNEAVTDWFDDGVMDVVWFDQGEGKLQHREGIIPLPPDYASGGMLFEFMDLEAPGGSTWSFMKSGADRIRLLYGEPLTQEQMEALR